MQEITSLNVIEGDTIKLINDYNDTMENIYGEKPLIQKKTKSKDENDFNFEFGCEFLLSFMNSNHSNGAETADYYKYLKKRIPIFKKEVYKHLTPEDRDIIRLLDKYTMKLINESIKKNVADMKEIKNNTCYNKEIDN